LIQLDLKLIHDMIRSFLPANIFHQSDLDPQQFERNDTTL